MSESIYSLLGEWYKWYKETFPLDEKYIAKDSLCTRTKNVLEDYERDILAKLSGEK